MKKKKLKLISMYPCLGKACADEVLCGHSTWDECIKYLLTKQAKLTRLQTIKEIGTALFDTYGKDGGDALVILSNDESGTSQRPALPEILALLNPNNNGQ